MNDINNNKISFTIETNDSIFVHSKHEGLNINHMIIYRKVPNNYTNYKIFIRFRTTVNKL